MTRCLKISVVSLFGVAMLTTACSSAPGASTSGGPGTSGNVAAGESVRRQAPRTAPTTVVPTTAPAPVTPPTVPAGASGAVVASVDIPDTDYPVPPGAVFMSPAGDDANPGTQVAPVRSIRRAVDLVPAGGTVVLRAGEHRTWYTSSSGSSYGIVDKKVTIQPYPHEKAWFNGADVVTGWTASGGRWTHPWSTPTFCDGRYYQYAPTAQPTDNNGPCAHQDMVKDPAHPVAGDPQMLFVDGVEQRQVATAAQVTTGTFSYDWSSRTLTMGTDPTGRSVEAAARPVALILGGYDSVLRGIGFHRYASNEQNNLTGAAVYEGGGAPTVENVAFVDNAGTGLAMSTPRPGSRIVGSVFASNGANALTVNGSSRDGSRNDLLIDGNLFRGNNAEQFGRGCAAACTGGAIKFARMQGFVLRGNVIEDTLGPEGNGFWCDLNCKDGVMVGNLVRDNGRAGIFYEVSSAGLIASNLVIGNGDSGILVSSATTRIWNNTVVADAADPLGEGVTVYDDPRGLTSDTGPDTSDVELVNNLIVGTRGRTFATYSLGSAAPERFFTRIDHNAYASAGQNIINWKSPNTNQGGRYFSTTAAFRSATGWGQASVDSTDGSDPFVDRSSGRFTIKASSPLAGVAAGLLPADVASAIGIDAAAAVGRGAITWPQADW